MIEDVKHAEAAQHRREGNGDHRACAQREQQTGDEGQHGEPEPEGFYEGCCSDQRKEDRGGLIGCLPIGEDLDRAIRKYAAARKLHHYATRKRDADQAQPEGEKAWARAQGISQRILKRGNQRRDENAQ